MTDAGGIQVDDEALDLVYALCKAESAPLDAFRQRVHDAEAKLEPRGLSVDEVLLELGQRAIAASSKAKRLQRDPSSRLSIAVSNQSTPQPRPENFGVPPPSQPPSQRASAANTPAVRTREHSVVELSSDEDEEERQRRQDAWDRAQCRKFGFSQRVQLRCGWTVAQINARLRKQEARRKREKFAVPAVPTASSRADRAARVAARHSAPSAPAAPPSENEAPIGESNNEQEENSIGEHEREPEAEADVENSQGSARTAQKRNGQRASVMLCLECQNELDPWAKRGRCAKCNEKRGVHEHIEEIGRTYASRRCSVCKTVCVNMDESGVCGGCQLANGGHEERAVVDVPPQDEPPAPEIDVVALDDSNDEAEADDDEPVEVPRGSSSQSVGKRASIGGNKRKHRSTSPVATRRPRGRPPKSARSGSGGGGGGELQEYRDYCLECLTPSSNCSRPFLMNRCAGCFEKFRDHENATAAKQGAAAAADAPFAHSHDGRSADESVAADVLDHIVQRVAEAQAEAAVAVEVDGAGAATVEAEAAGAPPTDANAQAPQLEAEAEAQGPREYAPHEPDEFAMDDEGQRHVIIVK
ncbi:hypothetical protein M3Y99_01828500 [Aphelenchoides fujianensis]|nr:hypothetical protein M3Y99_01828500 [Aphelenchoides fujianensis]